MNNIEILTTPEKEKETQSTFWTLDANRKVKINQIALIKFLQNGGFFKMTSKYGTSIIRIRDNKVREVADYKIVDFIKEFLLDNKHNDVLDVFSTGMPNYLNSKKLDLLDTVVISDDRDSRDSSWFYYKNSAVLVSKDGIQTVKYEDLPIKIWESRIINRAYVSSHQGKSDFEEFIYNIAGKNDDRFLSLKSIIGYLLHRYQDPSVTRAVILVDENISLDGTANGGTGKTLITEAIGKMRELVGMDGKNIKGKSWFKNQRITRTTDIVRYDDVQRDFNLETLYSMITSGITVEKKYQDEFYIRPEHAPKIVLSSNYPVKGTGGSTDERRRCEFEVSNHYNLHYQPIDDFGYHFFDDWGEKQWNQFYNFMMSCVQTYLANGLTIAEPINLTKNKLVFSTSKEFVEFIEKELQEDVWIDKRAFLSFFTKNISGKNEITPHLFTKWLKKYASLKGLIYEDKSSGGNYTFILKSNPNKDQNGE
ncbi:hypothetical protein J1N09_01485 [Aureitalea sp. L0-47]|uniref:DUF5906 domain-containing protein n=1 Tax=Aureitalea sp. L0-47 TaxID=2816962 RepID=UPI002238CA1E|nr:DUF5906 domain-containing protein [Aureitalea sp. L0-47]MCW5518492.1 hypothetical protein [Aureitalea sp. L0-47]